jgi:hypothetical protein
MMDKNSWRLLKKYNLTICAIFFVIIMAYVEMDIATIVENVGRLQEVQDYSAGGFLSDDKCTLLLENDKQLAGSCSGRFHPGCYVVDNIGTYKCQDTPHEETLRFPFWSVGFGMLLFVLVLASPIMKLRYGL